jgi:hypothetical protein
MTQDIIEIAKQADAYADAMDVGGKNYIGLRDEYFAKLVEAHTRGQIFKPDWDNYRQGLIDGATAEREACLQIQEDWQYTYANDLVQKIRARGEQQ